MFKVLTILGLCFLMGCSVPEPVVTRQPITPLARITPPPRPFEVSSVSAASVRAASEVIVPGTGVTITLGPSPSPGVVGYKVYYGPLSGVYTNFVDLGNSLTGFVTELTPNWFYYFAATSYDENGVESKYSVETTHLVEGDLVQIILLTGPTPTGPWIPILTNSVSKKDTQGYFYQNIRE